MFCTYDKDTKKCLEVGTGTNTEFYKSIGMTDEEVEQAYDGSYYLKGYAPTKSLDELKSEKLESLSDYANQFDQYKCDKMYVISSVGGYKFNTDIRSQTNIQGLIDMMTDETTLYRDYDNEFRTLTKAELTTLKNECLLNGQHLYQQKWDLQSKINACKSVEELNAIEIKFEMLDFS